MLAALQAFHADRGNQGGWRGRVGRPAVTKTGVRRGCPLSPTLLIDALAASPGTRPGITIQIASRGMTRHLSALRHLC